MNAEISLTLQESVDTDDGVIRLDQSDMRLLGALPGDILSVIGSRTSFARALPAFMEDRNQRLVRVSPLLRRNVGLQPGQKVQVTIDRQKPAIAEQITLQVEDDLDRLHLQVRLQQLIASWHERAVVAEDWLRVPTLDRIPLLAKIARTTPSGPVKIAHGTQFTIVTDKNGSELPQVGGLRTLYRTCKNLAVARLRNNGAPTTGAVLLTGPTGSGKALLVARLAMDMKVPLMRLDVHELLERQLSHSLGSPDASLTAAIRRGPGIVLLDHLDALNFKPEQNFTAMAEAQYAVLNQLCNLLDQLPSQRDIMLFGVTNGPIDPRFRDHQRFDLELPVDTPNRRDRHEILLLATQNVALADRNCLIQTANMTAGCTARDLQLLVRGAQALATETRLTQADLTSAFRHITPSALSEVQCDTPDVAWDEIAGLEDIKQLMRDTISWSIQHTDKFIAAGVQPPRSILLSGGRGSGKTSFVRALAAHTPLNFIEVACPVIAAREPTAAARYIKESFAMARRKAPCLLFLDDIDALFDAEMAETSSMVARPLIAQLLTELDALGQSQGIIVVAATDRPDRLPADIMRPGRLDFAVSLPLPDTAARKEILYIHAHKLPLAADVDFDHLANITQNMSPADIANLCNRAGLIALRQSLSENGGVIPPVVNAALFEQILRGKKN